MLRALDLSEPAHAEAAKRLRERVAHLLAPQQEVAARSDEVTIVYYILYCLIMNVIFSTRGMERIYYYAGERIIISFYHLAGRFIIFGRSAAPPAADGEQ